MPQHGKFFAIEGGDGSGKGTQTALLVEALKSEGVTVHQLSFPRYGTPSAIIVEQYLRGEFGEASDVAPELASAAYALDRVAAKPELEAWLKDKNSVTLADRYVLSNMAHQGTKIADKAKRFEFYKTIMELEFGSLQLPRPDTNVILLVPTDIAQQNVDKKAARSYTTAKRDIHEKDSDHLTLANRNYREIAELFPEFATAIEAYDPSAGRMRPIPDIQADIRRIFNI